MSTITDSNKISTIAQAATAWIDNQTLLSQSRCVDIFLDLYLATDDVCLQWSISERITEIRYVHVVRADEMRADLDAILAIAKNNPGIDLDWTDQLLRDACLPV